MTGTIAESSPPLRQGRQAAMSHSALSGALDLSAFFRLLGWRARLIGAVTLGVILAAAALLFLLAPSYTATAVLLLDPREPRVTNSEAVLPGIGSDAAAVESQVELVKSPVLARKVIDKLQLQDDPEFTSVSLVGRLKELLGFASSDSAETEADRLLDRFEKHLTVDRRGLTYILEINFSAGDPDKAARIANAVAQAYIDGQQALRSELTKNASQWLDERINDMRDRLQKSEQAVADYKASHHIVDVTQGNKLIGRRMEDVSQQLALAQSHKAEIEGRIKQIETAKQQANNADALAEAMQSQTMSNLRSQYANAARLEAQYRAIYGNQHPFLIAAREQLAELRKQIDGEVARVTNGLRSEYDAASKQQASLEAELADLKTQSEKAGQVDVPLAALQREADANKALFDQYLSRVKETDQEQNLRFADARVVSPALPPLKPARPGMLILLGVAGVLGVLLGIGVALLLEHLRRGLRTAEEVEQYLGLPCLGIVPDLDPKFGRNLTGLFSRAGSPAARYDRSRSAGEYARSVAAIATRLKRSADRGGDVLVIASALPGEGKSTFASNLARAAAASGVRTLLIDGDSTAREITRMYNAEGAGLSELCHGTAKGSQVPVKDAASGLYVVGAGERKPSKGRDFDEEEVAAVLREYRQVYDLIVIDSPAILPTGGGRLIECAGRVVLVVEWNRTHRDAVLDALALLQPHDRKAAGVVLNKASTRWYRLFDQGRYLRDQYSAEFAAPHFGPASGISRVTPLPTGTAR